MEKESRIKGGNVISEQKLGNNSESKRNEESISGSRIEKHYPSKMANILELLSPNKCLKAIMVTGNLWSPGTFGDRVSLVTGDLW